MTISTKSINCSSYKKYGDIKTLEEAFFSIKKTAENLKTLPKFIVIRHYTPYNTPGIDDIVLNCVDFPDIICDRADGNKTEIRLRDFFREELNITLF